MTADRSARLIVNADDLGLTVGTNHAIFDAAQSGIVTSASLLANGDGFDDAIVRAGESNIGIGVHLTLTELRPLTTGLSAFTDSSGYLPGFLPLSNQPYAQALLSGKFDTALRAGIRAEFAAQIEKVISAGVRPTHIDGHKYIHLLPGIASIVADLAVAYNIPVMRLPHRLIDWNHRTGRVPGMAAIWLMAKAAKVVTDRRGLRYADWVGGFADTGRLTIDTIRRLTAQVVPGTTELLCHPAYPNADLTTLSGRGLRWINEYQFAAETSAVSDSHLRADLESQGWELTVFTSLAHRPASH